MKAKTHKTYTTGEVAKLLGRPAWAVRRAVDSLDEQIPRAGLYRLIPAEMLEKIRGMIDGSMAPEDVVGVTVAN